MQGKVSPRVGGASALNIKSRNSPIDLPLRLFYICLVNN